MKPQPLLGPGLPQNTPPSEYASIFLCLLFIPSILLFLRSVSVPPNNVLPSFSWFSHWSFIMKISIKNLSFFRRGDSFIFHSYNMTLPPCYSNCIISRFQLLICFESIVCNTENGCKASNWRHVLVYMVPTICNIWTSSKSLIRFVLENCLWIWGCPSLGRNMWFFKVKCNLVVY